MQRLLTEPEKYLEALLQNDRRLRHQEEIRRFITERDSRQSAKAQPARTARQLR